ncbi:MAG TPA: DUF4398 domain-containing protein [Nevskia sp.]|nr:DUF4398 domain-containing protein [Nevskia sp.]
MKNVFRSYALPGVGGALALAACAALPQPPVEALQAADISIANADKDHATDYAPLEMRTAREKIAVAHAAAQRPDEQSVTQARQLADEARADADLASAKARLAKADAVNQALKKDGDALRQETQRGSGG